MVYGILCVIIWNTIWNPQWYPYSKPIIILYVNGLWSFHDENPHTVYTNPCEKRVTNPQYVALQSHLTKKPVDIHT